MRISGFIGEGLIPLMDAAILPRDLDKFYPVRFVINTHYWTTRISKDQAYLMKLNYSKLIRKDSENEIFILNDAQIRFMTDDGEFVDELQDIWITGRVNLLCRDILSRYRVIYSKDEVWLER